MGKLSFLPWNSKADVPCCACFISSAGRGSAYAAGAEQVACLVGGVFKLASKQDQTPIVARPQLRGTERPTQLSKMREFDEPRFEGRARIH